MPDLLDRTSLAPHPAEQDERRARTELRRQIGRLEHRLGSLAGEAFPRLRLNTAIAGLSHEPRVLGLGELEQVRDSLAARIREAELALEEREAVEERNRRLLERMLAAPEAFKWVRISRADVGEPGCGHWHSRPRLGLLGMLMGWWRVRVSSGCPLCARLAAVDR